MSVMPSIKKWNIRLVSACSSLGGQRFINQMSEIKKREIRVLGLAHRTIEICEFKAHKQTRKISVFKLAPIQEKKNMMPRREYGKLWVLSFPYVAGVNFTNPKAREIPSSRRITIHEF